MMKVLLVDDHQVVRDGLKTIIVEQGIAGEFGEATTADDAMRLAAKQGWDLAVVDISLAGRNGLEVVRELKQVHPQMPVLVLSMHSEEQYARRAFRAGAAGYITKDSSRVELAGAMAKVMGGGRYVSPALAERLAVDLNEDSARPRHQGLSDREFEVMRLLGAGKTVGQIAGLLSLSDKTISTYRARILEKMHLETTAEIVRYVIENKLTE
jgi:two-component system, NarL family, invasion response regulator UvrY